MNQKNTKTGHSASVTPARRRANFPLSPKERGNIKDPGFYPILSTDSDTYAKLSIERRGATYAKASLIKGVLFPG